MPTIGVAIAIPPPYAAYLQEQRAAVGDPLAHRIPPHVTLLPPTHVDDELFESVEAHLADVAERSAPFEIALRSTGTFRPVSPVVFVQLARGVVDCELLEKAIRSGPVVRDLEFSYHPHVTIAHHVADEALDRAYAALASFAASFPVTSFHLYTHGADAVWRPVREFAFGGERRWSG